LLGLQATRERRVPVAVIAALPLLGGLTLNNILSLDPGALIWGVAAATYALGALYGARLQKRLILARDGRFVRVAGEWVTLTAMMVLFSAGFVRGVVAAVSPDLLNGPVFASVFTAIICLPAGQFLGRALTVLRG